MPAHWVELQGVHLAVARAPHLTPEVGMRTGLCRSGTKVCVVGQELFLSLKMCALGSAPCTERKEHGSTNILPPGANPPHSVSMSLPGSLFLSPGCCPAFLGRFIVWLLPSHHEPLTGTDLTINTLMMCFSSITPYQCQGSVQPSLPISAFCPETAVRTIPAAD